MFSARFNTTKLTQLIGKTHFEEDFTPHHVNTESSTDCFRLYEHYFTRSVSVFYTNNYNNILKCSGAAITDWYSLTVQTCITLFSDYGKMSVNFGNVDGAFTYGSKNVKAVIEIESNSPLYLVKVRSSK